MGGVVGSRWLPGLAAGATVAALLTVSAPAQAASGAPAAVGLPQTTLHAGRTLPTEIRLHDGRVLISGGDAAAVGTSAPADIYDPTTKLVTATSPSPDEPRSNSAAVVLADGRVLIVSSLDSAGASLPAAAAPAVVYDPVADSWTAVTAPTQQVDTGVRCCCPTAPWTSSATGRVHPPRSARHPAMTRSPRTTTR